MNVSRILREGLIAGLIGAGAVATWFLITDTVAGTPFITPAMLGAAFMSGVRETATVEVAVGPVLGYTLVHVVLFVGAGIVAATFAALVERFPTTLVLVAVLFALFETGFYAMVMTVAEPALGALAWWSVAVGNLIAALGMGVYLWQVHPRIRDGLKTE